MYIIVDVTTHIKNFKVVETVVDGLQKALGQKVHHGLLEQLNRLRLKVFDNLLILLQESV